MADLADANLTGADLRETNLNGARFHGTNLSKADLTGARVYGIAVWDIIVDQETIQRDLIISPEHEPTITVDSLEVAQFIYLLLKNERIREVIDILTSKVVLILGRFTPERKAVLDALREALRRAGYVPVLFDFDVPRDRDVTETVTLLARLARFIVADLSEASSISKELESIIPQLAVPVLPLIEGSNQPYSMFKDYWKYRLGIARSHVRKSGVTIVFIGPNCHRAGGEETQGSPKPSSGRALGVTFVLRSNGTSAA